MFALSLVTLKPVTLKPVAFKPKTTLHVCSWLQSKRWQALKAFTPPESL